MENSLVLLIAYVSCGLFFVGLKQLISEVPQNKVIAHIMLWCIYLVILVIVYVITALKFLFTKIVTRR